MRGSSKQEPGQWTQSPRPRPREYTHGRCEFHSTLRHGNTLSIDPFKGKKKTKPEHSCSISVLWTSRRGPVGKLKLRNFRNSYGANNHTPGTPLFVKDLSSCFISHIVLNPRLTLICFLVRLSASSVYFQERPSHGAYHPTRSSSIVSRQPSVFQIPQLVHPRPFLHSEVRPC